MTGVRCASKTEASGAARFASGEKVEPNRGLELTKSGRLGNRGLRSLVRVWLGAPPLTAEGVLRDDEMKTGGFLIGLAFVLYGAYITGSTRVTCSHSGASGAACSVEVRGWLNKAVVERDAVSGVHGAATQSSTRKVTDNPTARPSERVQREAREWRLVLTGRDGTWLKQLPAGEESVARAQSVLSSFAKQPSAQPVTVGLGEGNGTIFIGIGVFVFLSTLVVPRREGS